MILDTDLMRSRALGKVAFAFWGEIIWVLNIKRKWKRKLHGSVCFMNCKKLKTPASHQIFWWAKWVIIILILDIKLLLCLLCMYGICMCFENIPPMSHDQNWGRNWNYWCCHKRLLKWTMCNVIIDQTRALHTHLASFRFWTGVHEDGGRATVQRKLA